METKYCAFCAETILGRTDKKYCNDYCRTAAHNQKKSETNQQVKWVDSALKKNRKILADIFEKAEKKPIAVLERKIQELGFVFHFHTHTLPLENGKEGVFCYDYGYIKLKQGELAIIKQN